MLDTIRLLFRKERGEESGADKSSVIQCKGCNASLLSKELHDSSGVCPHCGYYFALTISQWVKLLTDEGSFKEIHNDLHSKDPLKFPGYDKKLKALGKTEKSEGIATGIATLHSRRYALGVMNTSFMMGSMGSVVGEKICRLLDYAAQQKIPAVLIIASGGARMQEGVYSLMQMARTSAAVRRLSDSGGLFIPVLTNPTTGGVSASFAMLGDIILAEPGALIGFAGPRVIQQTIQQALPNGFQRSEFLLEKGFVDRVVARNDLANELGQLIKLHSREG
jgi:acetyl-CoA carboxylase carboxyl transferase subunit beta